MSDLINRESLKQKINLNYNNNQYIDAQTMKDIINTELTVEYKTVEELEKIKDEILNLGFSGWADKPKLDREEVLTILDKHISELKGEDK